MRKFKDWITDLHIKIVAGRKFYDQHWEDLMIYGKSITYTRMKYNPLYYILGPYKRIDPTKVLMWKRKNEKA